MITFRTAYLASKKADRQDRVRKLTDSAPLLFWLRKDGSRGRQVLQDLRTWSTVEEAEAVANLLMEMNPTQTVVVVSN